MSTVKSKNLQVGTDATASNNFTIYQPSTPDGTLRIGVGNADSPTEVGRFTSAGYKPATAPAFRANATTATSLSNTVSTKAIFDYIDFDTTSDFDTSNYRYTPSVAGYYQFNAATYINTGMATGGQVSIRIKKNGSVDYYGNIMNTSGTDSISPVISITLYANGTTDYFEIYVRQATGATHQITSNGALSWFTGHLVQQA